MYMYVYNVGVSVEIWFLFLGKGSAVIKIGFLTSRGMSVCVCVYTTTALTGYMCVDMRERVYMLYIEETRF